MSTLRSLAVKILHGTVRLAPPHAREWSSAMLSEVDFIEKDWSALSWALGSTRLLFARPTDWPVEVCSLPEAISDAPSESQPAYGWRLCPGCGRDAGVRHFNLRLFKPNTATWMWRRHSCDALHRLSAVCLAHS
jgi:hypothetical protein